MGILDILNDLGKKKVEVQIRDFSTAAAAQCIAATIEHSIAQKKIESIDDSDKALEFLKMTLEVREIEKRMTELSNTDVEIQAESEMVN